MADDPTDKAPGSPRARLPLILFRAATEGVSAVVLFVLMAMTCIDVTGRDLFNSPLNGATELTQLMLGIVVFGVLPVACYREDHITVDLLDSRFPKRLWHPRQALLNFLMAIMMAFVAWRVWVIGALQLDYGDTTEFLRIPLGPISYFIAVMSGIASLGLFAAAVRHLRGRGRTDIEESHVA